MVQLSTILGIAAVSVSLVIAAPAPLEKRATCTFTNAASAIQSKAACATIILDNIAVPAGTTLDMTDLTEGTTLIFEGETSFGFEAWSGPLVSVSGTDITVTGASGNLLNGNGNLWWDGQGSNGGITKPTFFDAHNMISSSITGLNIKNTPVQMMSIDDSTDLTISDINMNNLDGNTGDTSTAATNTDAFDIGSSTGITISGATINNQDDCMAVNSGTNIIFTGGVCSGGHGLSIGSVGGRDDNTVETVTIEDSTVENSMNGIRIKTVSGATGSVSGVTFKSIVLSGITEYGVVIEQDYENGDPTGVPTTGVPITGLVIDGISGTMASGGINYYILCGSSASCADWTWTDVSVTGGTKTKSCENVPSIAQTTGCT